MNIACPYCESSVEIEEYYEWSDTVLRIVCDNWMNCGAQWDRWGDLRIPSKLGVDTDTPTP